MNLETTEASVGVKNLGPREGRTIHAGLMLLTVVAEIAAQPGKEEEVRNRLLALIKPTLKEEGCVQYDLHESRDQPGLFVVYENWASQKAFDGHLASQHVTEALPILNALVREPISIRTFRRIP